MKPEILPVGPAREEKWRRVLRTTGKEIFLMRWCAVKHRMSKEIPQEINGFHGILEFPGNPRFYVKLKIFPEFLIKRTSVAL